MLKTLSATLCLIILTSIYTICWYAGSEWVNHIITRWIQETNGHGFDISHQRMKRSGFPFSIKWEIPYPTASFIFASREIGVSGKTLSVGIDIWQPLNFKFKAQKFTILIKQNPANKDIKLHFSEFAANTSKRINSQLPIKYRFDDIRVSEVSENSNKTIYTAVGKVKTIAGIITIDLIHQPREQKPTHNFSVTMNGIKSRLPSIFNGVGDLEANFIVNGDCGDGTIEDIVEWRDEGGTVDIKSFGLKWSPIDLSFEGTLSLDRELRPIGAGTIRVSGTESLIDRQVLAGRIRKTEATLIKIALALATQSDQFHSDSFLQLPITAQDGVLKAGPFKLTKLSRIIR